MSDRTTFLDRVRAAGRLAELPPSLESAPDVSPPSLTDIDLAAHFTEQLERVDGVVHHVTAEAAPGVVRSLLTQHGAEEVMAWSDDEIGVAGVGEVVRETAATVIDPDSPRQDHAAANDRYAGAVLGVTGAAAGLAESGSIVVTSGRGRARMASLIPLIHVAVLPKSRLHRSLTHLVVADPGLLEQGANVVFITGPSRTGDIEQELNLGVHGPKHLHVLLVEDL